MLISFFVFLAAFSTHAAEMPDAPVRGRHKGRAAIEYFSTSANYDGEGSSQSLAGDGEYSNTLFDLQYFYDWQPDWRLYAGGLLAMAQSDAAGVSREDSGLSEFSLGAQKWYDLGRFEIAPQADLIYSLVEVDELNGDGVLMGEGATRVRAGTWVTAPMKGYKPFGFIGFEYRDGGRSSVMPYEAGLKARFGQWWAQGSVRGIYSVTDDQDSDDESGRTTYLNRVNAGSLRYYSVNPSVTEVALEGGAKFGRWGAFAGAAMTMLGSNAAEGFTVSGGVTFTPGRSSSSLEGDSSFDKTSDSDSSAGPRDSFDIKDEKYDHSLFEGDSKPAVGDTPPPGPPPPPVSEPSSGSKPVDVQFDVKQVKKKKKKVKGPKTPKALDNILNDAEKSLEGQ